MVQGLGVRVRGNKAVKSTLDRKSRPVCPLVYRWKRAMKQIVSRLLLAVPVVWLVVSLVFLLIHLVPGDPIQQILGEGATPADIGALRHQYGLDQSLGVQYLRYWNGVLHGDLG